jgi:hypothetical protein
MMEAIKCVYCGESASQAMVIQVHLKEAALPRRLQVSLPLCARCRLAFMPPITDRAAMDRSAPIEVQKDRRPVGMYWPGGITSDV